MNFFKSFPVFAVLALSFCGAALAVPAYPGLIESKQPDGSVVQIRVMGNEHFHYTVSEDSELVVRDSTGYWNYADEQGKPTGMRFHHRDKRGDKERKFNEKRDSKKILKEFQKRGRDRKRPLHRSEVPQEGEADTASLNSVPFRAAPLRAAVATPTGDVVQIATRPKFTQSMTQGEIRGLIILVQFSDVKFKSNDPQADFSRYMNEEGYHENGMRWSVRDYYVANSMGAFKPTFDVAAPVTLSNTRAYYGTLQITYDGANYYDYPDSAFTEAINLIRQRGDVDFTLYDNDGDKYVDFVYMIYAGIGEADTGIGDAIWPQASYTNPIAVAGTCSGWSRNCYYVSHYACSNEISGNAYTQNKSTKTLAGIGTFVHEYGHVLGLPDFYNTEDMNDQSTPFIWSLMDMGEYNSYAENDLLAGTAPPRLTAFERYSLGWLTPRVLEKQNGEITLYGIDRNDAILIPSTNKNEYFFLDYRAKYDEMTPLPSSGLLVWRVSYNTNAWDNNTVNVKGSYRMNLIRADKNDSLQTIRNGWYSYRAPTLEDENLKGDPFPGIKGVTEFDEFVTYARENLGLRIYDIAETDSAVTFKVKWDGVEGWPSSSSVAESSSSSSEIVESSSSESSSSSAIVPGTSSSEEIAGVVAGVFAPQVHMTLEGRTLHIVAGFEGEKEIRVFDVQGHQLHSERFAGKSAALAFERFGQGALIVRLTTGNRILAVKRL
ncbi:M6 family metalloprotease domain-containing protein [Fibrobacter sp.]